MYSKANDIDSHSTARVLHEFDMALDMEIIRYVIVWILTDLFASLCQIILVHRSITYYVHVMYNHMFVLIWHNGTYNVKKDNEWHIFLGIINDELRSFEIRNRFIAENTFLLALYSCPKNALFLRRTLVLTFATVTVFTAFYGADSFSDCWQTQVFFTQTMRR